MSKDYKRTQQELLLILTTTYTCYTWSVKNTSMSIKKPATLLKFEL